MSTRAFELVILSGEELKAFARGELTLPFRETVPRPEELGTETDLLLLDPGQAPSRPADHPALASWDKEQDRRRVVLIGGAPDWPMTRNGPPWPFFLTPRECLRHLSHGATDALADELLGFYAEQPGEYLTDTGEQGPSLGQRLARELGSGLSAEWKTEWKRAVEVLKIPGRVRDLGDLTVALVPHSIPPALALEAARCVMRARHQWYGTQGDQGLGQTLPSHPLLLVMLSDEALPLLDTGALLAGLTGAAPAASGAADPRAKVQGLWLLANDPQIVAALPGWRALRAQAHYRWGWDYAIRSPGVEQRRALDRDLSALFGRLLVDHRPLRHYGCTFFFPFDPGPDPDGHQERRLFVRDGPARRVKLPDGTALTVRFGRHGYAHQSPTTAAAREDQINANQAMLYFLPHLREQLYDLTEDPRQADGATSCRPVQEWRLADLADWRLELDAQPGVPTLTAAVESVRLLRYFNNCYLLALRVGLPPPAGEWAHLGREGADWWHPLVFGTWAQGSPLSGRTLERWLGYTRLTRVIYPSFEEQSREGKIAQAVRLIPGAGPAVSFAPEQTITETVPSPRSPGKQLSPILRFLLCCFFGDGPIRNYPTLNALLDDYKDFYDDRLFVNVAYGLAGPAPESERRRETLGRLFSLALFVDRPVDTFAACGGLAYDRTWLKETLDQQALRIWEETGLYAGFTDFSNAYLGSGDFFCDVIAPRHVPYSYERMLILCLFYQTSLRRFSRLISEKTRELTAGETARGFGVDAFGVMRKDFIDFTNRYWFHEVTSQLQGKRMFQLQQKAMGLEQEYQFIKDEMERADEFAATRRNEQIARFSKVVGAIGLFLGLAAVASAILPLVPLGEGIAGLFPGLVTPAVWWRIALFIGLVGLPSLLICLLLVLGIGAWLKRKST